jgi:hypothetical protein
MKDGEGHGRIILKYEGYPESKDTKSRKYL